MRRLIIAILILLFCSTVQAQEAVLNNGTLEARFHISHGGAFSYFSVSGMGINLVNTYDKGRLIQQSYYMGEDKTYPDQHRAWRPWPRNPIQGGDVFGNPAQVVDYKVTPTTLYTKTIPMFWDRRNVSAPGDVMEQWVRLVGPVCHVRVRYTVGSGSWNDQPRHQEMPAFYFTMFFSRLVSYTGNRPWTNGPLTTIVRDTDPDRIGFPWTYWDTREKWAAVIVDRLNAGVAVYMKDAEHWIGGKVRPSQDIMEKSPSTFYVAPLRTMRLRTGQVIEYEYEILIDTVPEIRKYMNRKRGR